MDVEKEEHSSTDDGIASWCKHSGNQSGGSSENWTRYFRRTLLYHSWAYTQNGYLIQSWKKRPTVTVLLGYFEINIRTNGEIQSQKSRSFIICSLLAGGLDITAHKILRIKLVNLKGIKHEKKRNQ